MRIENLVINCTARYPRTCRRTPFEVVVYELKPVGGIKIIDKFI